MPLKAFFFLLRNPGLAEVVAFRSLIFQEPEDMRQSSKSEHSIEVKNKDGQKENMSKRG